MKTQLLALAFTLLSIPFCQAQSSLIEQKQILRSDTLSLPQSVELHGITYLSDGLKIKGYLAHPEAPGSYPVIIFNRGGNRSFGELTDRRAARILGDIASWGYVAIASNYRGSTGSEGMEEFGGAELNDIFNLIPVLAEVDRADTSRIGIYGWSRGGMMTYLALKQSCIFKAAVVGAGVTNAFRNIEERPKMETYVFSELVPNYEEQKEQVLKDRSAVYWADQLCKTTPLLLLHGSSDWRVSPEDALEISHKLYESKHPFRLLFLEGGDHGLSEYRLEVKNAVRDFMNKYVRDLQTYPSMEPHGR